MMYGGNLTSELMKNSGVLAVASILFYSKKFFKQKYVWQFFSVLRKQIYMVKKDHRVVVGGVGSKQPPVL